jgi:hypothetical protein
MKKIIYSLLISATFITCAVQTRLTPGEIKGKHETFIIYWLPPLAGNIQGLLSVYSKSNKYNNGMAYPKDPNFVPMSILDKHVNNEAIKQRYIKY